MKKINDIYIRAIRSVIVVTLYFIWPSLISSLLNIFNIDSNEILQFIGNIMLLVIILFIYRKDILFSMNNLSSKKMVRLFIALVVVQVLTNLLSILILGVDNHTNHVGLLPTSLEKWPVLVGISMTVIYPILESLIFNKSLKDVINNTWAFILCSALFFWLVNLFAFNFNYISIIATMSCFTTSIVINYFYCKEDNISSIIIVKMIYNLIFLLLP